MRRCDACNIQYEQEACPSCGRTDGTHALEDPEWELSRALRQLNVLQLEIDRRDLILREIELEINRRDLILREIEHAYRSRLEDMREHEREAGRLRSVLAERDEEVARLKATLDEREATIATLRATETPPPETAAPQVSEVADAHPPRRRSNPEPATLEIHTETLGDA